MHFALKTILGYTLVAETCLGTWKSIHLLKNIYILKFLYNIFRTHHLKVVKKGKSTNYVIHI